MKIIMGSHLTNAAKLSSDWGLPHSSPLLIQHEYHACQIGRIHVRPACRDPSVFPQHRRSNGRDFACVLDATFEYLGRRSPMKTLDFGYSPPPF